MRKLAIYLLVIATFATWGHAQSHKGQSTVVSHQLSQQEVVDDLMQILKGSRYSARLMYISSCRYYGHNAFATHPQFGMQTNPLYSLDKSGNPLEQIRALFAKSPSFVISEQPNEIIEITQIPTSLPLFQVKIGKLMLTPMEAYNSDEALDTTFGAHEVAVAEKKLRLRPVIHPLVRPEEAPSPDHPHLPDVMTDITVDHVVNQTLLTFRGLFVYGQCMSKTGDTYYDYDYFRSNEFDPE